ncbi:glycosyltransferase family protein [Pseudodonghicola flavimaris]|uniref:Glycosyltransferase n=1 Tax=Pseudodonghicola flavimaris TaxID=3050036 RepID=A0ABT7F323_9RHOB|nr:glycosyltransferase [Pseudodonghicola flavimaris]MDK3019006.1 glycosyltransferase [Pseudodonghicola flavimaris]
MKVMIVVTHLLGTGHLARALTLGHAFAAAGHEVLIASGGRPAPHLDRGGLGWLQLPPLASDGVDFTRLLTDRGEEADAAWLDARITALREGLTAFAPDVLITELFPFGRRSLSGEFLALLETARDMRRRPVVLASIRDILAPPSKPKKAARAEEIVTAFYDAVLVHSDPAATTLDISWPLTPALTRKLRYTGYVAPPAPAPHPTGEGQGEVLVSAGGGAVGDPIFETALATARLRPDLSWRLLVGGGDPERLAALRHAAPANARVEPARPDFRQMLPAARASVSMCGYNTAMDLLQAGTPAVLVPFDAGKEVEQGLRAASLARLPGISLLPAADLDAAALATALDRVIAAGPRQGSALRFDGAARSVAIASEMAEAGR